MGQVTSTDSLFERPVAWLWDALFPVNCLSCEREGSWLCGECVALRPAVAIQRCVFCNEVSPGGETCRRCRRQHLLSRVIVRGVYREWVWSALLKTWKYGGARDLDVPLTRCIEECAPFLPRVTSSTICLPVPLSRRREADRGFNQATVLAETFGRRIGVPIVSALRRVRHTAPQSGIEVDEREGNVADAFVCRDEVLVAGKRCILIDDIVTTGATLDEAARVLRAAGALEVSAVVLTRSDLDSR